MHMELNNVLFKVTACCCHFASNLTKHRKFNTWITSALKGKVSHITYWFLAYFLCFPMQGHVLLLPFENIITSYIVHKTIYHEMNTIEEFFSFFWMVLANERNIITN